MLIPYKLTSFVSIGGQMVKDVDGEFVAQDYEFDFPTAWEDLKYYQGLRLYTDWYNKDREDLFLLLSILTDVPSSVWENAVGNIERDVITNLQFLHTPPDLDNLKPPKTINIDGRELTVPENLMLETFGQKIYLQNEINTTYGKKNDLFILCPKAVAAYTYPEYYGEAVDSKKLKTYSKLIEQANFLDVYSAGRFFFLKSLKSFNSKVEN